MNATSRLRPYEPGPRSVARGTAVLHESEGRFTWLTVNRQDVFYVETVAPICRSGAAKLGWSLPPGYLYRQPRVGGERERLSPEPVGTRRLLANERYVFWETSRLEIATGSMVPRTDDCQDILAMDRGDAFLVCPDGIGRLESGDGPVELVVSTTRMPRILSVRDNRAYWTDGERLFTARFGEEPVDIGQGMYPSPYGPTPPQLGATREGVYFGRFAPLQLLDRDGRVLDMWDATMLLDDSDGAAYFVEQDRTGSKLQRVTGAGTDPEVMLPAEPRIAVDGGRLLYYHDRVLATRPAEPLTPVSPSGVPEASPDSVAYADATGSFAEVAVPTADGGVVIAHEGSLARFSESGALRWNVSTPDGVPAIATDGEALYCLVRGTVGPDPSSELIKLGWEGSILWERELPGGGLVAGRNEGVTVAGSRTDPADGGSAGSTRWSWDVSASGTITRSGPLTLSDTSDPERRPSLMDMASHGAGFVIGATEFTSSQTCEDGTLADNRPVARSSRVAAFDTDGSLRWRRLFVGGGKVRVVATEDGGAVALLTVDGVVRLAEESWTVPLPGIDHGLLLRLDVKGRTLWKRPLPSFGDVELVSSGGRAHLVVAGRATEFRPLRGPDLVATSPFVARIGLDGDVERAVAHDDRHPRTMAYRSGRIALLRDEDVRLFSLAQLGL